MRRQIIGLLYVSRYRGRITRQLTPNYMNYTLEVPMSAIIYSGISIFGLISLDPAIFCFLMVAILFGGLNFLEYKRFD